MDHNVKQLRRRKEHREIFEMIAKSDIVIQVLDARFPEKCRSKILEEFAVKKNVQMICCINKTDLIPKEIAEEWKTIISRELPTVFVSTIERQGTSILRRQIERFSTKSESIVGIVGYPNVGKSSLINVLKGKKSAPTSPRAGFTRHLRPVRITNKLMLIDTPGVAPRENLALEEEIFLGTVAVENIYQPELMCSYIFDQFKEQDLLFEMEKYLGMKVTDSVDEVLENFARKRGLIRKNAEPQIDEAARIIIRDFMTGKITYYEKPKTMRKTTKLNKFAETS